MGLRFFWFEFARDSSTPKPLLGGCGVSAEDLDDAMTVLGEWLAQELPAIEAMHEGATLFDLPLPATVEFEAGAPYRRGVWLPKKAKPKSAAKRATSKKRTSERAPPKKTSTRRAARTKNVNATAANTALREVLYALHEKGELSVEAQRKFEAPGSFEEAFQASDDAQLVVHLLAASEINGKTAFESARRCVEEVVPFVPARCALVRQAFAWASNSAGANDPSSPDIDVAALMSEVARLESKRRDETALAAAVAVQRLVQARLEPDPRVRADHLRNAVGFAARAKAFSEGATDADYALLLEDALADLAAILRADCPIPAFRMLTHVPWMRSRDSSDSRLCKR